MTIPRKSSSRYVRLFILAVLAGGWLLYFWYSYPSTSLEQAAGPSLDLDKVSAIEVVKSNDTEEEQEVAVTDPAAVHRIITALAETKLRKRALPFSDSDSKGYPVYWITIRGEDRQREAGMILTSGGGMALYTDDADKPKNKLKLYRMDSGFDFRVLSDLFR